VTTLYPDGSTASDMEGSRLPGDHGKGAYTGHGRLVFANNGERSPKAKLRPDVASGCLAEWNGRDWNVVRRNQFCEVTGPGGIYGNKHPETDPIWSIGWDHRSLILMVLDAGQWHWYRLPKASHTYDGAHGWNTEWPRIREIGEEDLLMTMHGAFWRFPRGFTKTDAAGIRPRSTYLKVIGDFARCDGMTTSSSAATTRRSRNFLTSEASKAQCLRLAGRNQIYGSSNRRCWTSWGRRSDAVRPGAMTRSRRANGPIRSCSPAMVAVGRT
jgi:hypothetical protein